MNVSKLRVLDLFSGIGGFSLGLERTGGFETVGFCEIDPFCRQVLAKHWPDVPIHEDVRTLEHDGPVDVICGGYPCQPFSLAGNRRGTEDDRHLWPEMHRLVVKHRPTWVLGENVAGHISMGLDQVLSDLENEGYACRVFVIPACAVDAPHRRDRAWIMAYAPRVLEGREVERTERQRTGQGGKSEFRSDAVRIGSNAGPERSRRETGSDIGRRCAGAIVGDAPSPGPHTSTSARVRTSEESPRPWDAEPQRRGCDAANAARAGLEVGQREDTGGARPESRLGIFARNARWLPEPPVGRVAHGVSSRVDRLKALGNAVVPRVVEMIGWAILEAGHAIQERKAS